MGRSTPITALMEQFDTLSIQCRHIKHMHEGVWFGTNDFCLYRFYWKIFFSKLRSAGLNYKMPSFFTDSYCAGVSNKHCLLTVFHLSSWCLVTVVVLWALPHGAVGWPAVCNSGISWSHSLFVGRRWVNKTVTRIFILFLNQNICCEYPKESSQWDSSFEQPKHML